VESPSVPVGRLLLGYQEVARLLGISPRSARGLVYAGKVRAVRIGRRRLVARSDLDAFIAELREEARQ
jgi:excisionase family DNA binding protein